MEQPRQYKKQPEQKKRISDQTFNTIEDAYNVYKQSKKAELVKNNANNAQVLDNIWGGLRSIDKDKNTQERMKVLKMYHEQNNQMISEHQRDQKMQKERKKEIGQMQSQMHEEYRNDLKLQQQSHKELQRKLGND